SAPASPAPPSTSTRGITPWAWPPIIRPSTPDQETPAMKKTLSALALSLCLCSSAAFAAAPKTYQVTGPVLELTDDTITVQKGKEKWETARSKDTKVPGELKVGSKVTIEYRMSAASVEVKDAGKAEKPAKK